MIDFRKHILIVSAIAVLLTITCFLLFYPVPAPPVTKMEYARKVLSIARKDGAETYATVPYMEAKGYYDSAMDCWRNENQRFIYFRDYSRVSVNAGLSAGKARQAVEDSKRNISEFEIRLRQQIEALNAIIADLNKHFTAYPLTYEVRNRISKGKLLLKESENAYVEKQYFHAGKIMAEAELLLKDSYEYASSDLKNYFNSFPVWRKWVNQTIAVSKEDSCYSIIIDKFSRKCIVYFNGMKQYQYNADLGRNWVGDKRISGDKATPEGMYRIIRKLDNDSTMYYKALLLNYPNEEDTAKFILEKAKGSIPHSAQIGGLIEIHGRGGKGTDWTEGCIALTDIAMDTVFKIVKVGTPVTIVGSMYSLQHILNR